MGLIEDDGKTPIQRKREKLLATIARKDPFIAQFLEYLFTYYTTLKEAFRLIDINNSRSISKSEFKDGLFRLRKREPGQRPGPSFVEFHLTNLFSRLDIDGSGHISIQEMLEVEDSEDKFVQRLARYLLHVRSDFANTGEGLAETMSVSKQRSEEKRRASAARLSSRNEDMDPIESLMKVFSKFDEDMTADITEVECTRGLKTLKYDVWMANDIFDRLDENSSGSLSLGEFTAFLEKEGRARERKVVEPEKQVRPMLYDAQAEAHAAFTKQFNTGAHSLAFSMKLQRIGRRHINEEKEHPHL